MVVATGASASRHIDLVGTDWLEVSNCSWCGGRSEHRDLD